MANDLQTATQNLVRSPGFQNLEPTEQLNVMKKFMGQRQSKFGALGLIERDSIAGRAIESYRPSVPQRIGGGIKRVGEFVSEAPIVRPALQLGGAKDIPEGEEVGFFTEALTQGATLSTFGPTMGPEVADSILESTRGRVAATLARDVAELGVLFTGASSIVRLGGAKLFPKLFGEAGETAAGQALRAGTSETAENFAKQAAFQSLKQRLSTRVATDFTFGELFGVVDAMEHQDFRPLEQLVINPLAIAGLGLGLFGGGAALRRFGPVRVQEAAKALESDIGLQGVARDAQQFSNVLRKASGLGREEAGEIVFKAARGTLSDAEFSLIRNTIVKNPRLLGNDFGLHLARQLRPKMQLKTEVVDEGLTVAFEDALTRRETYVRPASAKEAAELIQRAEKGEIRLLSIRGREAEIRPFLPERPAAPSAPVEVVTGTEPTITQLDAGLERLGIAPAKPRQRTILEQGRAEELGPEPQLEGPTPQPFTLLDQFGRPIPGIKPTLIEGATAEMLSISNPKLRSAVEIAERKLGEITKRETEGFPRAGQPRLLQLEARPITEGPIGRFVARPEISKAEKQVTKLFSVLNNRARAADVEFVGAREAFAKPAGLARFRDPKTGVEFELPTSRATLSAIRAARKQANELAPKVELPVKPVPGSEAEIAGGGGKVGVLENSPQGTTVKLPSGEVAIGELKVSGRVGIHQEALEPPPKGTPRVQLSEGDVTNLKARPTTLRSPDKPGRRPRQFKTTPNPVYDTVTIIESQTKEPLTVRSSVFMNWIREGKYLPAERDFARMNNEELARVHQALYAAERGIDKANPLFSEKFRDVQERRISLMTEWLRRKGALDEPVSSAEGQLFKLFRETLGSERGSIEFEKVFGKVSERPAGQLRSLPANDAISVDSKFLGGRALEGPNGEIVLEFKVGNQTLPFTFRNRVEADSALRQVAQLPSRLRVAFFHALRVLRVRCVPPAAPQLHPQSRRTSPLCALAY